MMEKGVMGEPVIPMMNGAETQVSPVSRPALLEGLSTLLTYPGGDFRATLSNLSNLLDAPGAGPRGVGSGREEGVSAGDALPEDTTPGELIRAFDRGTAGFSTEELEELYTRTFDLNPAASLETGWQLYGEAYERGAFLVKMRSLLRKYGVPEGGELPDHLASILRAMARMPEEEAAGIASAYLRRAVAKMISAFPDGSNPYLNLLKAASLAATGATARKESEQP